ncbi:Serine/threonine-protein kinase srk1 [Venturia nashicola]|nr:Serine/threonine-protein kinase srk1 [Venturia nashicola]
MSAEHFEVPKMGKKRRHPDIEEVLGRPWCYYCERDFDDLKILISHQKAKHFKCDRCGRRLNTAGGLSVHMNQVHKEQLNHVENALPDRQGLDVEIFGMEGIPEEIKQRHDQRVTQSYWEAQAQRRADTGNPAPGGIGNLNKRPKLDAADSLKARLAAHKARVAAGISGPATPLEGAQASPSPAVPVAVPVIAPPGAQASPPPGFGGPYAAPPRFPAQPGYGPPPGQFPPPGVMPFPGQQQTVFQPPSFQASPPLPYGQTPHRAPPRDRPASSDLPQRPAFNAPPINAAQLQQLHHGPSGANGKTAEAQPPSEATPPPAADKKPKKDKTMRLIYGDNDVSPEEKMSLLPKYSFTPGRSPATIA